MIDSPDAIFYLYKVKSSNHNRLLLSFSERAGIRNADAAGLVRRFADGCAAAGDAGQPSAPGTEGTGGLLRDDESDVPAGDNRKLAEQPNRGGNCAAERAGGRLLRGATGETVDEGYIR